MPKAPEGGSFTRRKVKSQDGSDHEVITVTFPSRWLKVLRRTTAVLIAASIFVGVAPTDIEPNPRPYLTEAG